MSTAKKELLPLDEVAKRVREMTSRKDWQAVAHLSARIPATLTEEWVPVVDEIAFGCGLAKRAKLAMALYEQAWALQPGEWRRASAMAYIYYSAALERRQLEDTGRRAPETQEPPLASTLGELREGFRTWIGEALALRPDSVKDLYRLGMFESRVESEKEKTALRAFIQGLEAWERLPAKLAERGDMVKYRHKLMYAGARSALAIGKLGWARRLSFQCIREDVEGAHVARVFQLALGGKVCLAAGEPANAERAFRLALDAPGPRHRDFLFGYLADARAAQGDVNDAIAVIDEGVPPARRAAFLWRKLGDYFLEAGSLKQASKCFEACLAKDRMGRHLTLVRLGKVALKQDAAKEAERYFRKARDYRRKMYQSEDREAISGLIEALERRGKTDELAELRRTLATMERRGGGSNPPIEAYEHELRETA